MALVEQGLGRLAYQYEKRPNIRSLVVSILAEYAEVDQALDSLKTRLSIDLSSGVQLDEIGKIVGQQRPAVLVGEDDAFTFIGAGGKGFASLERPDDGGVFVGGEQTFDTLDPIGDADYRRVLKAVVIANYATSSIPQIIMFFNLALSLPVQVLLSPGFITIEVPRPLFGYEQRIVDNALPVAAGIGYEIVVNDELPLYEDVVSLARQAEPLSPMPEYENG